MPFKIRIKKERIDKLLNLTKLKSLQTFAKSFSSTTTQPLIIPRQKIDDEHEIEVKCELVTKGNASKVQNCHASVHHINQGDSLPELIVSPEQVNQNDTDSQAQELPDTFDTLISKSEEPKDSEV